MADLADSRRLRFIANWTPTLPTWVLPKRWIVERSVAWTARVRRLANDDERLPETVVGQ